MLAGVLLPLCLAPVRAVAEVPLLAVPVVVVWVVVLRFARQWAVPAALAAAAVGIVLTGPGLGGADLTPALVWTAPRFDPATLVGVGLPLFLVTMASQNVPGMAVLATYGYRPRLGPDPRRDRAGHARRRTVRRACGEPGRDQRRSRRRARRRSRIPDGAGSPR